MLNLMNNICSDSFLEGSLEESTMAMNNDSDKEVMNPYLASCSMVETLGCVVNAVVLWTLLQLSS